MSYDTAVSRSYALLKWAFGLTLILIGVDKVFGTNLIADWQGYVSPLALSVLPMSAGAIVLTLGSAEIVLGILFLTQFVVLASHIAIAVLLLIIVNLLSLGLYDIAARDALIALSALVLSWLAQAKRR